MIAARQVGDKRDELQAAISISFHREASFMSQRFG